MRQRKRKQKNEGRVKFREFMAMNNKLHEMLRSLGEEQVSSISIKLDEFEKLRLEFVRRAEELELSNNHIELESDQVERAKLLFSIRDCKMVLQSNLKQMTTLVMKLNDKVKKEKAIKEEEQNNYKKQGKYYEVSEEEKKIVPSPLEKQLQYKTLILYSLEKSYFKLIKKQSKQAEYTRRDLNNNKFESLEDFKKKNPQIDRLLQKQHEQTIEQRQILQALKQIDNLIEQRMDKILQGIKMLNYNAVNISKGIDDVHKLILINLDKVEHNEEKLKQNQKRLDQASKVVTKPNCICNIIIIVLLALIGYLVVKIVWFSN